MIDSFGTPTVPICCSGRGRVFPVQETAHKGPERKLPWQLLFRPTRGRENLRARIPGDLKCGEPDTASCRLDEYPFACVNPPQVMQRVICSKKSDRYCCRFFKSQMFWLGND